MNLKSKGRTGFTLIEVIIFIAILSIIIPTLPLLVSKSEESIKEIRQSSFFSNGYTMMNSVLSKLWDEKNVDDVAISGKYFVLNSSSTSDDNALLDCTNNYRAGHYQEQNRRKCSVSGDNVSAIGLDGTESVANSDLDDIDDFNGLSQTLTDGTLKIDTTVDFIDYKIVTAGNTSTIDTSKVDSSGNTTDIKRITIKLSDMTNKNIDSRKEIKYYYFATNIGTDIPLIKVNN